MPAITLSSREFDQNTSSAKKATADGPVFITDHGEPAHVLLAIEDYQRLIRGKRNLAEAFSMPRLSDIDFDAELERPKTAPGTVDFD